MTTIAFFGIGMMGAPMAGRLRGTGHDVRVWNRTAAKANAWARDGGTACATPAEAASGASSIHLMLSDDEAVEAVLGSALAGSKGGILVVDHSTVSVAGTRERVKRLKASGHSFLSAPVFGGPANMAAGEGTMLVAGDRGIYDGYAAVLHQIIEKHWYVSADNSEANAFKLMGNSLLLGVASALNEFYAIAKGAGLPPLRAYDLLNYINPGAGFAIRGARMAKGDYAPAFAVAMADKDARLMIEAAHMGGYEVPGLETIRKKMRVQIDAGRGGLDLAAINYDLVPPG